MKIKSLVNVLDVHKETTYNVVRAGEGWVVVVDSLGDEFTLVNYESFGEPEFEIVDEAE